MKNKIKIGNLVKRRQPDEDDVQECRMMGIVLNVIHTPREDDCFHIHWSEDYGQYWTRANMLEKVA